MADRPNVLLITTDEERFNLPHPAGFSLPARERLAVTSSTGTLPGAPPIEFTPDRGI